MVALLAASEGLAGVGVALGAQAQRGPAGAAADPVRAVPPQRAFSGNVAEKIGGWTPSLLSAALSPVPHDEPTPPTSLPYRSTRSQRSRNADAADRLKYSLFRALPQILDEVQTHTDQKNETASLQQILSRFQAIIEQNYAHGDPVIDIRNKMELQLTRQWDAMRSGVSFDDFEVGGTLRAARTYQNAFEASRKRFTGDAKDIFSPEVRDGAAFGNLGSQVILSSLGRAPTHTDAVMALTLLHPITDDALDRGLDVKRSMGRITEVLQGTALKPDGAYEEVVFALIGDIFASFKPSKHPALQQILLLLHKAQLESVKTQKTGAEVDRGKLLELTARKGGLTALAMAYVSLGALRLDEAEFFYKAGLLFQLGDDLMDVAEDHKDGTTTLWTLALKSKEAFRSMMQQFFAVQEHLEISSPLILTGHPQSRALANDLRIAFRFYLFSSLLNPTLDRLNSSVLKNLSPLSSRNIRSIAFSLFKGLKLQAQRSAKPEEAETISFLGRVFDKHFLGGAFGRFESRTRWLSPRFTYRITDANPLFFLVKIRSRFQNLVASYLSLHKSRWAFAKPIKHAVAFALAAAYIGIPQLIQAQELRVAALGAMLLGIVVFMWGPPQGLGSTDWRKEHRARLILPFLALIVEACLLLADYVLRLAGR